MGKTVLNINDVNVGYGGVDVIHDITFDVKKGEMFGLIGLNGAGKTTLIKSILGLREISKGNIGIFDLPPGQKESRRHMAFLPERFEPPWFLSGMEFVKMSMRLYGQTFDEDRVYALVDRLALDRAALKRRVQTYSKGMRQKLGLIATILTDCKLMILDEPMSGLDPKARTLVKDTLVEGKKDEHTVFLSSHILADMDEICDRVAVIHNGVLGFVGPPAELKKQVGVDNLERAFLQFIEHKEAA